MDLQENMNQRRNIKEFNVPAPWGHIAVKAWGNENDPHVLVIHGRMDNAGSFDNLIPLLPNTFYYICVDLPGHGKSSPFPAHLLIHSTDYLIPCKILVDFFKKQKYIILAHSYGGQVVFLFARVFPECVEKVILLEVIPFQTIETKHAIKYLRGTLETTINTQKKLENNIPPSYTYEEALRKLSNTRYNGETLIKQAAEPLLKRSLINKGDGKYYFSTDQRMKSYINPLHDIQYSLETFKHNPITVPILMIFAKLNYVDRKQFSKILEKVESNKNVTVLYVDGHHDVHNNYPERVAGYVNKFLLSQKAKL